MHNARKKTFFSRTLSGLDYWIYCTSDSDDIYITHSPTVTVVLPGQILLQLQTRYI